MQHLSMVIITVEIFGSEIEQKLSKGRIFQFSWNEKNYNPRDETGELFLIFNPQPSEISVKGSWVSPPLLLRKQLYSTTSTHLTTQSASG